MIGMPGDVAVGNPAGNPNRALVFFSFSYHFHDPYFIRISDGEGLSFARIAVFLHKLSHYLYRLGSGFSAFKGEKDQGTIVNNA